MTCPPPSPLSLPLSEDEIVARAAALGLAIPAACMAGVVANMVLLDRHARALLRQSDAKE